jgi:hypothetical protein
MLIREMDFVVDYIAGLEASLKALKTTSLTRIQCHWLAAVLVGIIVSGNLSWAAFSRRSLGAFKESQLRWMFRYAKIAWDLLLQASVARLMSHYGTTMGVLVLDDSDKMRSRNTSKIAGVHKVKDKKTGGWFMGQEFVFLLLVTETVTIPVGFRFYVPDPALKAWKKLNKEEKKAGVPLRERTKKPEPNPAYPGKKTLALELLSKFAKDHPEIKIQCVLADALYGDASFMDEASKVTSCPQIISQLRSNQLVRNKNGQNTGLKSYFSRTDGVACKLIIRGGEEKNVTLLAGRLVVKSHAKKRFVIALKYEGETEYRFIVATDLTWRHKDIAIAYSLRWLVEVFIADWKGHGGWNTLSKQQGDEGAVRGMTLSLLCDHLLLLHPEQSARLKNKQPGMPVGCLIEHINAAALIDGVSQIVHAEEPKSEFEKFRKLMEASLPDRKSSKHMAGRDIGRLAPTPSLKYQKVA